MEDSNQEEKQSLKKKIYNFYDKKYKLLFIIPIIMLVLSLAQIAFQISTTGDFINKDVSLKGGVTLTVPTKSEFSTNDLQNQIKSSFPASDISVRTIKSSGAISGFIVEADIDGTVSSEVDLLLESVDKSIRGDLKEIDYSIEIIGSSLGQSFFRESLIALLIAFIFMGTVVFIYFRTFAPSIAIVLAAFSDMVVSLAVINIIGMEIGTAGIAAFLMLIGYSVDTDILLSVRVLKRKEGTVMDRIMSSMRTGMTMTLTSIVAVSVALFVTDSEVIKQIMTILLIGLGADIINTWLQNVGILRLFIEKKEKKGIKI
jgi:preprotein translocase subunit SecF